MFDSPKKISIDSIWVKHSEDAGATWLREWLIKMEKYPVAIRVCENSSRELLIVMRFEFAGMGREVNRRVGLYLPVNAIRDTIEGMVTAYEIDTRVSVK